MAIACRRPPHEAKQDLTLVFSVTAIPKLQRLQKEGLWIVDVSRLARRSFIRHCQNLNGRGKAALCVNILSKIKSLGLEQDEPLVDAVAADQLSRVLNDTPEPTSVTLQFDSYADVVRSSSLRAENHTKRSAAGECQHGSMMTKILPTK
ncbi:hypothetical protein J6590_088153 [Homalodisca vitripennis]|nr:hypothetical protein J6590_088153 [Homalodisca vitripennis]